MSNKLSTPETFWKRVAITSNKDECWEWTASRKPNGYGQVGYQYHHYGTHQLAYILTFGKIPSGLEVRHKCDNPLCCNPNHLLLGTHLDNMKDAQEHGKFKESHTRKLREQEIRNQRADNAEKIRQLYYSGQYSMIQLARLCNISISGISRLISRHSKFTHATLPDSIVVHLPHPSL
jgi:hypothetical protein